MADIVLKPVDGALYKTIKPYMIENLAAFSKQFRLHAADSNTAAKNLYAGLGYVFVQRAESGDILEKRTDLSRKLFHKRENVL